MKPCPFCDKQIEANATKCPRCQMDLTGPMHASHVNVNSRSSLWVVIVVSMIALLPLIALMLPSVQNAKEAARRSYCKSNLKIIGLALHNYHDIFGCFPPANIADEQGNAMHSWRVLILPFLDEKPLYDSYDFTEPWDSPVNAHVLNNIPSYYCCPSQPTLSTTTNYSAVFGPDCIFTGAEPVKFDQIIDGTSNTLLIGEVAHADIPWTKPEDIDITMFPELGSTLGFSSHHEGGVHFLLADGAVRFIKKTIDQKTLDLLYRRNDGETVSGY